MFIVIVLGVLLIIGIAYIIHEYKKAKAFKNSMTYEEAEEALEATPEWKTLNEVWDAVYATPEYKDYLKADEAVKATPEFKDWEKAYETRNEVKEAYKKAIKAKYEAMEEEAW